MSIAFVDKCGVTGSGATSQTTAAQNSTGANLLVAMIGHENAMSSFTDSKSNTWTHVGTSYGSSGKQIDCYYAENPSSVGASHTFTATIASSGYVSIGVTSYSGAATSSSL